MKRILLSAALSVALAGTAAFAQQTQQLPENAPNGNAPYHHFRHHPPNPQRQAEMLSRRLNLSPDQTARLTPIFADRDQKTQALFQDQTLTPQQRHEQMRAIHQSTQQQLATVLSPDQLQQMKAMRHGHRRFGPGSPNGNNGQLPAPQAPSGI